MLFGSGLFISVKGEETVPASAAKSHFKIFRVELEKGGENKEEIYKDYYINGGQADGLKEKMLVNVFRPKIIQDCEGGAEYKVKVMVGKTRVIRAFDHVAVARLENIIPAEAAAATLRHRAVMVGDYAVPEPKKITLSKPDEVPPEKTKRAFVSLSSDVLFDFNKSKITKEADKVLSTVYTNYVGSKKPYIVISGHTCSRGSDAYNLELSLRRAQSVAAFFLNRGFPEDHCRVEYYGESSPMMPNDNEKHRKQNRRVELSFEYPE